MVGVRLHALGDALAMRERCVRGWHICAWVWQAWRPHTPPQQLVEARLELGPLPRQRGLSRDDGARVVDDAPALFDVLAGDEAPARGSRRWRIGGRGGVDGVPVSYTHLTLPTILLV